VKTVLIVASGTPPADARLRELAARAGYVIAADGGGASLTRAGVTPDLVIGDLDSLPPPERDRLEALRVEIHAHPNDKDATDLELAVDRALAMRPNRVWITGVLGGPRTDHAVAAVLLLEKLLIEGVPAAILGDVERLELIDRHFGLSDAAVGDTVSLLPISEEVTGIHTSGLRYRLANGRLRRAGSRGISNVVDALPVRVDIATGRLLVVHRLRD